MNFFEDLLVDLKEENLLEDTVIDLASKKNETVEANAAVDPGVSSDSAQLPNEPMTTGALPQPTSFAAFEVIDNAQVAGKADEIPSSEIPVSPVKQGNDREFYNKRATAEVSSLQMVEHVLSAVEREYHKKLPQSFDDFEVKKALNNFLQVTEPDSSDEHNKAEFALMRETEAWCSALAARDRTISVADLRRYCENCRPMLSSQAMLSLARFYRNLPYSEPVRGKFDFIITRLFSRPMDNQSRKLLFTAAEMQGHVKTLYAEWSSLALFSVDDPESNIKLAVMSFADLTAEAEKATEFDELIKSDFFNRLRLFKESIADLFYAPEVTVAAIECNVRVGNVYVELIDRERQRSNAASVHDKYSFIDNDAVSEATGRTLELVDVLRDRTAVIEPEPFDEPQHSEHDEESQPETEKAELKKTQKARFGLPNIGFERLGVNKWLLISGAVLISISMGLYVWANVFVAEPPSSAGVSNYDLTSSPFREDLKLAKVSGETFYGVLQPSWETMTKGKQEELVQKIYQAGAGKTWLKVNLMNSQGKTVAFMSSTRLDIVAPTP